MFMLGIIVHHEEENQPESPPISPDHKKKKGEIGKEATSNKQVEKDLVTQNDKEENSMTEVNKEMIIQIEVLNKKLCQRNE